MTSWQEPLWFSAGVLDDTPPFTVALSLFRFFLQAFFLLFFLFKLLNALCAQTECKRCTRTESLGNVQESLSRRLVEEYRKKQIYILLLRIPFKVLDLYNSVLCKVGLIVWLGQ